MHGAAAAGGAGGVAVLPCAQGAMLAGRRPWVSTGDARRGCPQVLIMGRDLSGEADHDLSPLISSGHITTQPPSTPWRDFLRYIEASRHAPPLMCSG